MQQHGTTGSDVLFGSSGAECHWKREEGANGRDPRSSCIAAQIHPVALRPSSDLQHSPRLRASRLQR